MQYFLSNVTIKDCNNVMIDGKVFSDNPVKNDRRTYDNLREVKKMIVQPAVYSIVFVSKVKVKATDSSKQQALDSDPKEIQILLEI